MNLGLEDKVAIVTGGSRGIGRSIALGLAAEGCDVAICARGEETLRATEQELGAAGVSTFAQAVDVTGGAGPRRLWRGRAASGRSMRWSTTPAATSPATPTRPGKTSTSTSGRRERNARRGAAHARQRQRLRHPHRVGVWPRGRWRRALQLRKAAVISHAKSWPCSWRRGHSRQQRRAGIGCFPGGGWYRRQQEDPEGMPRSSAEYPRGAIRQGRRDCRRRRLPCVHRCKLGHRRLRQRRRWAVALEHLEGTGNREQGTGNREQAPSPVR